MAKILIGMISGAVSGMGMGGRNHINTLSIFIYGNRSAYCTRSKFGVFYTNIYSINNHKYKAKNNKMENRINCFTGVE